jgi:hypothetical protein
MGRWICMLAPKPALGRDEILTYCCARHHTASASPFRISEPIPPSTNNLLDLYSPNLTTHKLTMRLLTSRMLPRSLISQPSRRFKSTDTSAALPPRWLSDVKARIGKCIMFGINAEQTAEAGGILEEMNADWRELVAGSEGYLTGREWMGLCRQEVVWGEMVCDS